MISRSSLVKGPGLRKMLSGTPIFPMSCRNAPRAICRNAPGSTPMDRAMVIVRLLQILQCDGKLLRALRHQMFQITLVSTIFHHQPAVLQRAPHAQMELVLLKGLQNISYSAFSFYKKLDGN